MPLPWFLNRCERYEEGATVDGVLCYEDAREFDTGEERPFLVSQASAFRRAPPPEYSTKYFSKTFGKHMPICGGRCLVISPFDRNNVMWITLLLIMVPSTTWFIFVAPALIDEYGSGPLVVAIVLILSVLFWLLVTWLVEPGVLPHVELEDRSEPEKPKKLFYVVLHGNYFLRRPFRAQNSRFTDSCIEGFDHYCPYVGNAIGKRNYRYFILFLTSIVLLSAFVTASAIVLVHERMENHNGDFWIAVKKSAGATVLAGFTFVLGLSVAILLGYHFRLMCQGRTTYEDLKLSGLHSAAVSQHENGCFRNCINVWCSPHYPSRVAGLSESTLLPEAEESRVAPDVHLLNESMLFSPSTPVFPRTSPRAQPNARGNVASAQRSSGNFTEVV